MLRNAFIDFICYTLQDLLPIIHVCPRNQYQTRRYGRENRRRKFFHGRVRGKIEDQRRARR